jgi:phosphatidylserine/phosphatidylglycerophosphate/cardiolipin synthase-like enzyme
MSQTAPTQRQRILVPGRNCWQADRIESAGLLIDADRYFQAFHAAALQAQRYLLIAGWRFNSTVRLLRGRTARQAGGEVQFLSFLRQLCAEKPELRIYILAWDFSIIYALEWELFQKWRFQYGTEKRLHFHFDDRHPAGASHHQKFVVIDGRVAMVGGMDFDVESWDTSEHRATHPDRVDKGEGEPHGPRHDIQCHFTGPAALELARYFQQRWKIASGEDLDLPDPPPGTAEPVPSSAAIMASQVALSRTQPALSDADEPTREVRQLYLDMIDAAEELIYAENQYFSSQAVFQALLDRMAAANRPRLEIVLILLKHFPSWIESVAMGPPRIPMLETLAEAARKHGHRLGVYYPTSFAADGREVPWNVHCKLTLVDDRLLTVGSANFSNRSLGLDTELNASWEAWPDEPDSIRSLRQVRVRLLAEHTGLRRPSAVRRLRHTRGLVDYLDEIAARPESNLRPLTPAGIAADQPWMKTLADWGFSLDPKKPLVTETLFEKLIPDSGPA